MGNVRQYRLINYFDVWGNPDDGWEVNNQCVEFDDLNITDDASNQDILNYLKQIGFLATADPAEVSVEDRFGEVIEIVQTSDGKPIAALQAVIQGEGK